ncbi:MAG: acyl-CoA dehydrogenase family protein [Hyphomonadaceae bacterium]|nr:acyl-CoA dehydrogenase family protein [Hyphomonadaceae bacterium]
MSVTMLERRPMTDWTARAQALGADFAARAAALDAADAYVGDNLAALKRAGFFAMHVPAELGGGGASYAETCAAIRVLSAECGATGLAFAMHTHIVALAAWRWRHASAPTDGLLRRVAGEGLALVSSGGSDWLMSAGVARKVEGGFRITARKAFASGCLSGDLLSTSAVYDDPEAGPTVLHFMAPLKGEGVAIEETWAVMGMRATGSHDVTLSDVFIADAAVSGRRPQGKWHPLYHMIAMLAFPIIYAAYAGVADAARARALAMARTRNADATLLALVGEMETAWVAADIAHADMVRLATTASPNAETTAAIMARRTLAGRFAIETATKALEVAGGAGFYREAGLERLFRDVQAARFHPLQEKPQALFSARVALGLDID